MPTKPMTKYEVQSLLTGDLYGIMNSRDQSLGAKDWASAELKRRSSAEPRFVSKPKKAKPEKATHAKAHNHRP